MSPEPPLDTTIMTAINGLHATIHDMRAELTAYRAELRAAPVNPPVLIGAYTVDDVATMLGKDSYTVRDWCRLGRINASKRHERRGRSALWSISAEEVTRYHNEGMLPIDPSRNSDRQGDRVGLATR